MANTKITDLTALTGANTAAGDQFTLVDVSDTTMDASGTNKKMSASEVAQAIGASKISSGAGAPASTPTKVGDIYIDTTADVAYFATGTASSADWQMPMAVATSTAGTWESRPQAMIVVWAAGTDTAATTPAGAVGDDIVILAEDTDLTAIAALTSAANKVPYATGAGTWAMADFTAAGRELVNDADAAAQRTTLGLGTIATQSAASVAITGGSVTGITDLAIADGGTGASTALGAVQTLRTAPATVTDTTDTLAAADDNTVILYTNAAAKTVTLANIATGFECVLVNLGAGALSVAAGGMSFANSFTPKLTVAQGESLYVKQTAASTFVVLGGTAT